MSHWHYPPEGHRVWISEGEPGLEPTAEYLQGRQDERQRAVAWTQQLRVPDHHPQGPLERAWNRALDQMRDVLTAEKEPEHRNG